MKIQEERSQYKNKKLDISRWEKHRNVKRGDSIGVFKGKEFKEVL